MATVGEVTPRAMVRAPSEPRWTPALQLSGGSALFAAGAADFGRAPVMQPDGGSGFADADTV